jgi:hypothetical protein
MTLSAFQKFSTHIWSPPHSAETWVRISLPYADIKCILDREKANRTPTTITAIIATIFGKTILKHPELTRYVSNKKIKHSKNHSVFITTAFKDHNRWDLGGINIPVTESMSLTDISAQIRLKSSALKHHKDTQYKRFTRMMHTLPNAIIRLVMPLFKVVLTHYGDVLEKLGIPGNRFGSIMITPLHQFGVDTAKIPLHRFGTASFLIAICKPYWSVSETSNEKWLPLDITFDHRVIDGQSSMGIVRDVFRVLKQLKTGHLELSKSTASVNSSLRESV